MTGVGFCLLTYHTQSDKETVDKTQKCETMRKAYWVNCQMMRVKRKINLDGSHGYCPTG